MRATIEEKRFKRPITSLPSTSFPRGSCFPLFDESGNDGGPPRDGVEVIDAKQVGPFDTVVLRSKGTAELVTWLCTNGYTQPLSSTQLIEHYVQKGMYFVAVKVVLDQLLAQGFSRDAGMLAILREFIPLPASLAMQGVDERSRPCLTTPPT